MRAPPVKQHLRPTLPDLIEPRWERAGPATRALSRLALAGVLAAAIAIALAVLYSRDPWIVHSGAPVAFEVQYPRALRRVPAPPGVYARAVERSHGRLVRALEVDPLSLPPYSGDVSGELPVFADSYIANLASRLPSFELISEGKARVDVFPGYYVSYSAKLGGRTVFGRNIMFLPRIAGVRQGVVLAYQSVPTHQDLTPDQIGVTDGFTNSLHSFRFRR